MYTACLLIQDLAYRLHLLAEPRLREGLVVVGNHALGVVDCSPQAAAAGIDVGMPLRQALARISHVVLVEPDYALYRQEWDRILSALQERSPLVEDAGLGHAYVGLAGLERLYGNDANLASALRSAIPSFIETRLGLGPGKFPAYIAALQSSDDRTFKAPQDLVTFLASKPVEFLPVPWEVQERLQGFGLRTLGQVAAQRVGPLQAQFGPAGRLAWELARGIDQRPLVPRQVETVIEESIAFPIPTAHIEPVLLGVRTLLQRAYGHPALQGRSARVVTLQGAVLNGRPWLRRIAFREAAGNVERAFFAIKAALDGLSLPGPLEELALALTGITGQAGDQASLFPDIRRRENLVEAVRQVRERTDGHIPLYRIQEMEPWSRHPERRHALVEYAL